MFCRLDPAIRSPRHPDFTTIVLEPLAERYFEGEPGHELSIDLFETVHPWAVSVAAAQSRGLPANADRNEIVSQVLRLTWESCLRIDWTRYAKWPVFLETKVGRARIEAARCDDWLSRRERVRRRRFQGELARREQLEQRSLTGIERHAAAEAMAPSSTPCRLDDDVARVSVPVDGRPCPGACPHGRTESDVGRGRGRGHRASRHSPSLPHRMARRRRRPQPRPWPLTSRDGLTATTRRIAISPPGWPIDSSHTRRCCWPCSAMQRDIVGGGLRAVLDVRGPGWPATTPARSAHHCAGHTSSSPRTAARSSHVTGRGSPQRSIRPGSTALPSSSTARQRKHSTASGSASWERVRREFPHFRDRLWNFSSPAVLTGRHPTGTHENGDPDGDDHQSRSRQSRSRKSRSRRSWRSRQPTTV